MANMYLVRIKGKRQTPSEAKTGTVRKADFIDKPKQKMVTVLWDGEKQEEKVSRSQIEIII
jgi:hypothetical protein